MKAILQDTYGPPDVLRLGDTEKPVPGAERSARAGPCAPASTGAPRTSCAASRTCCGYSASGSVARSSPCPDKDVAGTVVAGRIRRHRVRASATRCSASPNGSFAEYAVARADKLVHKPADLTFEQAAVVPISATTAMQALRDVGHVQAGPTTCSSSGRPAVSAPTPCSWPRRSEPRSPVCRSTAKVDLVRSLGADEVIDYTHEDFADGATRYDLILDIGGNSRISRLRRALRTEGNAGHRRRRSRKVDRSRPPTPRRRALAVRVAATRHVRQQGAPRGPRRRE